MILEFKGKCEYKNMFKQINKINEEYEEMKLEYLKMVFNEFDLFKIEELKVNLIDELFDVMRSALTLIENLVDEKEIQKYLNKNNEKILNREV